MKGLAYQILCALGWPARHRKKNRTKLAVLMYHGVTAEALEPFCWHQLPVDAFEQQLTWVKQHYTVLPLTEALVKLETDTLPDHAAAITFDDGLRNNLTRALPVLEKLGLPATIFVPTAFVGTDRALWPDRLYLSIAHTSSASVNASAVGLGTLDLTTTARRGEAIRACLGVLKGRPVDEVAAFVEALEDELGTPDDIDEFRLFSWDEAEQLAASSLIDLAPHSETHPILSQCDDARVEQEIGGSYATMVERLGSKPLVFAYPNGRPVDFDTRAKRAVSGQGMTWALSTEEGLADKSSDPRALPGVNIGSDSSFARFRLLVTGALSALKRS